MSELPTGTVTFLFTDIEGSTALLRELGERYARAISSHRRALHEAFSAHGGVEVDRQGDASFFAFQRAKDAIAAATEAQRTLEEGPVRVRMGIHTGEPVLTDGGYVGMDVHRAARIAAVGHGGQILVSQTTRDLLDDDLHDLGEHRLKDLTKPERLYQLSEGKFPPLRSLNFTNLPVQPTPLLGRERELAEAGELLGRNDVRLVTLVGPPGTGKTRLALAIAAEAVDQFEGGVWWVPLSTLRDSALVVPAIAQTLGAKGSLVEHLRRERTLLLLDNMEQVADAASELAELLRELDGVKLLVTSREPLHVAGEHEYPVLPLPDEAAIALFNERARSVRPDFPADQAVGEICARLDRLPLAIELAAARVKILEPDALLERLERRLPLLTLGRRDAPERQRTLRATIEWSYDLLTPGERRLFERLGVFAGGFTVEAAEEVSGASLDRLASLVDKSLVRQQEKGRFLLLETIREYALERLHEQADAADVHRSHRTYFFDIAERAAAIDSDITRYDRLRQDHHNFREALRSGFEAGDETALRLATSLSLYWLHSGYAIEGRRWLEAGLKKFPDDPALRSDALHRLCHMIAAHGDFDLAKKVAEERRTLCRRLGDTKGEADTLYVIGHAAEDRGQFEEARRLYDEAAGLTGLVDQESRARALGEYGRLASRQGNLEQAANLFQEALDLWRALGDDTSVAWKLQDLAEVAITSGDFPRARSLLRESISLSTGLGSQRQIGWWLETTAALFAHEGKAQQAARLFGAAEVTRGRMGETLDSFDFVFHDRAVAHLVAGIGETAYHEGVKLGAAMPTDAALDYALVSLD